jgi:hypothetical protein
MRMPRQSVMARIPERKRERERERERETERGREREREGGRERERHQASASMPAAFNKQRRRGAMGYRGGRLALGRRRGSLGTDTGVRLGKRDQDINTPEDHRVPCRYHRYGHSAFT